MIYDFVESFNNKTLFRNIIIILIFIYFFRKLSIGLNIILGIAFAMICIVYLYEKETKVIEIEKEQYKEKLESINPTPINIDSNKDLINFLFSVQAFYVYNP